MSQLDWWKYKHAELLLAKRSEIWLFNYCSAIISSINSYWNISLFYYNMSGHIICVWAQTYTFLPTHDCVHTIITCQGTNVSLLKRVWAKICQSTNVCGHKRVRSQTCLGTNVCEHKRVWTQTCVGTNVSGHMRVWAQMCVRTNVPGHKRVVSP